jgi:hypothetical protein
MKKILVIIVSIVIVFSIIFTGCSTATSGNKNTVPSNSNSQRGTIVTNDSKTTNSNNSTKVDTTISTTTQTTNIEIEGILYMAEEEKLARDVYGYLYDLWGLTIFKNIQSAEQNHMDQVANLVAKYSLELPSTYDKVGVFSDPHLQELYNTLIEKGSKSIVDALSVGALIEETDIADLKAYMNMTDNNSIKTVYSNLMQGSENHLRAFVSQLSSRGVNYTPSAITLDEYNAIIGSTTGKGNQGGH